MILPTKPSKLSHTQIIIKSKPQGSVDIQERFFLPQAKTSIQNLSETQTNTSSVSKKIFTGSKNDKIAVSFCRLYKDLWKGHPGGSAGKESASNAGDPGSIPGSGRSPGEGNGSPLQYSCLGNSMDRGAWRATVHGVTESDMTEQLTHTQQKTHLLEHKYQDLTQFLARRYHGYMNVFEQSMNKQIDQCKGSSETNS